MVATLQHNDVIVNDSRSKILEVEAIMRSVEGADVGGVELLELKHLFSDGIYMRQMTIPKGVALVGKIHKYAHPSILAKGKIEIFTEDGGVEVLEAPMSIISKEGTKRVGNALEETVWITVHHNPKNITDLKQLEDIVISKSYEDYDRFVAYSKMNIIEKMINKVSLAVKRILINNKIIYK